MADFATPQYWADYHAGLLGQIERAKNDGLRVCFQLLPVSPGHCTAADAAGDAIFDEATLAALPLPGCPWTPQCSCVYLPILPDEKPYAPLSPLEQKRQDRDYAAAMRRLPPTVRARTKAFINATFKGFGLKPPD